MPNLKDFMEALQAGWFPAFAALIGCSIAANYDDDGYRYVPELGISVQGQSAADAWKEVDRLAKKWRIPVNVEFVWRQNPKAQHPGKAGVLRSGSS